MVFAAAYIIVSRYFDKKKGKAMAFATLGSGVGSVVLSPGISVLVDRYGFLGSMIILSALMLNNLISASLYWPLNKAVAKRRTSRSRTAVEEESDEKVVLVGDKTLVSKSELVLNDVKPDAPWCFGAGEYDNNDQSKVIVTDGIDSSGTAFKRTASTKSNNPDDSTTHARCRWSCSKYGRLLKKRTFVLYICQIMCMQVCIPVYLIFLVDFAAENGTERMHATFILSLMGISDMVGRIFFGFVFDLDCIRGHRPQLHSLFGIAFGASTAIVIFARSYAGLLATAVAVGLTESVVHGQRATVATQLVSPADMSSAIGLMIFSQGVGNIWGPSVAGQ